MYISIQSGFTCTLIIFLLTQTVEVFLKRADVESVFVERIQEEKEDAFVTCFQSFPGVMRRGFIPHFNGEPEHFGAGFQSSVIYKANSFTHKHCLFIFTPVLTMS